MKQIKYVSLMLIAFVSIMGCSGNNANIKNQLEDKSEVTKQELIDNWSDYDISYNWIVIVFDPKNDNKKILVDNYWYTVEDQETLTQLVNGTINVPHAGTNTVWGNSIREIWAHNQFYGYVCHPQRMLVTARIEDENTIRLFQQGGLYRTYQ
jgi:hypothetical protein